MAEKPSLKDFSRVTHSGEIITIPIPKPFWLAALSMNDSQGCQGEIVFIIIPLSGIFVSSGSTYSEPSINSATK